MCIGLPMRVVALEPGHAWCVARGESRRVHTALVGEPRTGDWLLVFIDSAVEIIDARRAAEITATLDLLALADAGMACDGAAAFELPSATSREQLRALTEIKPCAVPAP